MSRIKNFFSSHNLLSVRLVCILLTVLLVLLMVPHNVAFASNDSLNKNSQDINSVNNQSEKNASNDDEEKTVNISGKITDAETGEPMEGVRVYLAWYVQPDSADFNFTVTDLNGEYRIENCRANTIAAIIINYECYATHGDILAIWDEDIDDLDIQLEKGYVLDFSNWDEGFTGIYKYNVTFDWLEIPFEPLFLGLDFNISRHGFLFTDGKSLKYDFPHRSDTKHAVTVVVTPIAEEGYEIDKDSWIINGKSMEIDKKYATSDCGVPLEGTIKADFGFHKTTKEQYNVHGFVYDKETGSPINNATVSYKENDQEAKLIYSDENGYYCFQALENDNIEIIVTADGYISSHKDIKNLADDEYLEFQLQKESSHNPDVVPDKTDTHNHEYKSPQTGDYTVYAVVGFLFMFLLSSLYLLLIKRSHI